MRAVMLAAGVGRRLAIEEPKWLLRFGGRTLLSATSLSSPRSA